MHLKIEIYGTETNKIENHTRYRVLAHSGPNQMPKYQKFSQQNALKIRVYHWMRYYIAFLNNSSLDKVRSTDSKYVHCLSKT